MLLTGICTTVAGQQKQNELDAVELESIRTRIKDVQTKISEARQDVDTYRAELQQSEMAATEISTSLQSLAVTIQEKLVVLDQLHLESGEQERILVDERKLLAEQVRIAYKTGRHDFLKLFLNQEDPALLGRMMTSHDYYNKARSARIAEIKMTLQNLELLQTRINTETAGLQSLRDQQISKLQQMDSYRESRNSIITSLNEYISGQDRDLQNLQRDEQELGNLLEDLGSVSPPSVVEVFEEQVPFASLKGKLQWPVQGKIIDHFGAEKKGGKLRWNGVRISATGGTDVLAVSPGKVIFADWFRNFGLLIIIDHGGGYMSLYGHNESLTKKAGDSVVKGETVSRVGDTGGQTETALYFEIRQAGTPQDPDLWCQG